MVVDELIVQIRASAEGVKEGVAVAKGELKKLLAEKDKLKQDLEMKIKALGIDKLEAELKELKKRKEELSEEIKFNADDENIKELKQTLKEIEAEKAELEKKIDITVDVREWDKAYDRLAELETVKKELSEELKVAVTAKTDEAKAKMAELDKKIKEVGREITVKINSSGIQETAARLKEVDAEIKSAGQSAGAFNKELAATSVAAGAAFYTIIDAIGGAIGKYNEFTSSMAGLNSQMTNLGVSTADAMDLVREKTADGLMSPSDVAASIKNLTQYGFTLEQTSQMIDRLKDSAANNRRSQYTLSEAVRVTTDGIRLENSMLSDAAGVTKNIAKMKEEYAKSIGKSKDSLLQADNAQAIFNGTMAETAAVAGDAAKYSETLAGNQDKMAAATDKLSVAWASSFVPALQAASEILAPIISGITEFVENNKALVAGLTAAGIAATGFATAAGILTIALTTLGAAAGPIGWIALAIGAAIGGIVAMAVAAGEETEAQKKLNQAIKEYNDLLKAPVTAENIDAKKKEIENIEAETAALGGLVDSFAEVEDAKRKTAETPLGISVMDEIKAVNDGIQADIDLMMEASEKERLSMETLSGAAKKYGVELEQYATAEEKVTAVRAAAAEQIRILNMQLEEYDGKLKGQENQKSVNALNETASAAKTLVNEYSNLEGAYDKLQRGERLSLDNLLQLIHTHPILAEYVAKTGDITLKGGEMAKEAARAEAEAQLKSLEAVKVSSRAKIKEIEDYIKALQAQARAEIAANGFGTAENKQRFGILDEQKKELESLKNGLNEIEVAAKAVNQLMNADFGGGSDKKSGAAAQKEENAALHEALKLLADKKALSEMSAKAEYDALEKIKAQFAKTEAEKTDIAKQQYALRREILNEQYNGEADALKKASQGFADNTDFSGIIDKWTALKEWALEAYKDYPKRLAEIFKEADAEILDNAQKRADRLLAVDMKAIDEMKRSNENNRDFSAEMNAIKAEKKLIEEYYADVPDIMARKLAEANDKIVELSKQRADKVLHIAAKEADDQIAQQQRLIDLNKSMNGVKLGGVAYSYAAADETADVKRLAELNEERLKLFEDERKAGKRLTDAEFEEYQKRLAAREAYNRKLEDLTVSAMKEEDKARQDAVKADEDAARRKEKTAKDLTKAYTDEIKKRHDAEVKAAQAAADAEIKIYQDKIAEIDALMKGEDRADADAEQLDRINRMKEMLKFEADDANRYELNKQISQEQADFDKRKHKEGLEDEKAALNDKITAVRDNLASRKEAADALRDAEIAAAEESYNRYAATLDKRTIAEKMALAEETAAIEAELGIRAAKSAENQETLKTQEKKAQTDKLEVVKKGTLNILEYLSSKASEFAARGRQAGQAWAEAYNAAAADIAGVTANLGGYGGGATTYNYSYSPSFYQPVPSPYKQTLEIQNFFTNAARYI